MTFRTDGDLVRASNDARDLSNLVIAYLQLWRKYANGKKGIRIPGQRFHVIFHPPKETSVVLTIVYTKTEHWEEATYYDVDSDYFSESWGSSNISGSISRSSTSIEEDRLSIPYSCLLQSEANMESEIKRVAARIDAEEKEAERLRKVAELEAELQTLKRAP